MKERFASDLLNDLCISERPQKDRLHEIFDSFDNYIIITLDACRADYYKRFRKSEVVRSAGSSTPLFYRNTFTRDHYDFIWIGEMREIVPDEMSDKFRNVIDLLNRDNELNFINESTNLAIREHERSGKVMVHYFKPHCPYYWMLPFDVNKGWKVESKERAYTSTYIGPEFGNKELRSLYEKNLVFIIQEYEKIIKNTDADVYVITSDHGELLGEKTEIDRSYGHFQWRKAENNVYPPLTLVPWRVER